MDCRQETLVTETRLRELPSRLERVRSRRGRITEQKKLRRVRAADYNASGEKDNTDF